MDCINNSICYFWLCVVDNGHIGNLPRQRMDRQSLASRSSNKARRVSFDAMYEFVRTSDSPRAFLSFSISLEIVPSEKLVKPARWQRELTQLNFTHSLAHKPNPNHQNNSLLEKAQQINHEDRRNRWRCWWRQRRSSPEETQWYVCVCAAVQLEGYFPFVAGNKCSPPF